MAKKKTNPRATKAKPSAEPSVDLSAETIPAPAEISVDPHAPLPTAVSKKIDDEIERAVAGDVRALRARQRRLARAGVDVDACPVFGTDLDAGPRAAPDCLAVVHGGVVMSARARDILALGATAIELEDAAAWLRARTETE